MTATLVGVGVGSGDPELLTLKAVQYIKKTKVLAYTVDEAGKSLARQIVSDFVNDDVFELPLAFSMSPQCEVREAARRDALEKLLPFLLNGEDVVFITEGDALLYSTFQHLLARLPAPVGVKICPGVNAMSAAAAAAVFGLAIENESVWVLPAAEACGRLADLLKQANTLVLYKANRWRGFIQDEIKNLPFAVNSVLVERASMPGELVEDNNTDWRDGAGNYFTLIMIRRVEK